MCPNLWNDNQQNQDGDGVGDVCDSCVTIANPIQSDGRQSTIPDTDEDGINDCLDTCPLIPNALDQKSDSDGDGIPTACDNCPDIYNPSQVDGDKNGKGDHCETAWYPDLKYKGKVPEKVGEQIIKGRIETLRDRIIKAIQKIWPF